ncbi:MAG: polysaccharide biosynthesis tyrosine autokinase [Planctomycetota bacterium]|nr:polysaccharide biosynthesis tyrosine autokinase [Planctomycetota bacterium]
MSAETDDGTYNLPSTNAAGAVNDALQFLKIVWYRRNTVFIVGVICAVIAAWYAATATRYYQSSSSILIVQRMSADQSHMLGGNRNGQNLMPTHQQLLGSQPVLENAIQYIPPECLQEFKGNRESWHRELAQKISTNVVRGTTVLNISATSTSSRNAVAIVNAVIQSYLRFVDETHKGTAAKIIEVMTLEKDEIERKLAADEEKLASARLASGDFSIEAESDVVHPVVQSVLTLNEAFLEAKKDRLIQQALVEGIQRAIIRGEDLKQYALAIEETVGRELLVKGLGFNPDTIRVRNELERGLLADIASLKSLSGDFGPSHPKIIEVQNRIQTTKQYIEYHDKQIKTQLDDLEANQLGPMLLRMAQQGLDKASQKESILQVSLEESRFKAVTHQRDTAHITMLEQNVIRLRRLHDAIIEQIAGVDLRQGEGEIRATIIKEAAASGQIVSPRISRVIACWFVGTLGIGFALVFVQDSIDDRFRTPDELSKRVGQPIIGLVRALPELKGAGIKKVSAHHEPSSVFVESFRTLRTSLALSASESTRIGFTSSEPGDGKTTVIANLAVVYAQSGKRTLVIDADLRRPGLTRLFDFKSKSGMSDILAADVPVQEIISNHIVPTDARNLDVLPAGPRRQNPSELLASDRLAQILAWAEGEYDQILVDCPPTLVASDAVLVGRITDGMVMVVRPEKNRRKIVFRASQNLLEMKIPVFGLVANCIDTENSKGYSFGEGEGYSYGYSEDEINEVNEVNSTSLNFEDCYAGISFQSKTSDSMMNEIQTSTQNRRVA